MASRGRPRKIRTPDDALQAQARLAGEFAQDPYGFVLAAFPWGVEGRGLDGYDGPYEWQAEILKEIGADLAANPYRALRYAMSAGNGPGKSSVISWLMLWALTTCPNTRGVVTANTGTQLQTKTWAELAKWCQLSIFQNLFTHTATAIYSSDARFERTWRIDAVPWSEKNPEAFAGLHNKGRRIFVAFDEASNIPDIIYDTMEGALTDENTEMIWLLSGNPTRNTGRFRECWSEAKKSRWKTWQIDTRKVPGTNKEQIEQWIEDYGEDSDWVRVHVKGEFPRVSTTQFISTDAVGAAMKREAVAGLYEPLVLGVDVARFGDDESVIAIRKGRDARTHAPRRYRGLDTMELAAKVAAVSLELKPDMIFIDGTGVGGGVVDRCRQLRLRVIEVQFAAKPDGYGDEEISYANKRAEIWGLMRAWLSGGAIPDDPVLKGELIGVEYGFNNRNEIQLERKDDMKKRGLPSPDGGDALALTFAHPVMPAALSGGAHRFGQTGLQHEYDPFASDIS